MNCETCRHLMSTSWQCRHCKVVDGKPTKWETMVFDPTVSNRVVFTVLLVFIAVAMILIAKSFDVKRNFEQSSPEYFQGFKAGASFMVQQIEHNKGVNK